RGYDFRILRAVESVNETQKRVLFEKISRHFNGDVRGRRLALWGLAFKPNTDDMREAPAVVLARMLLEAGAKVTAYDPEAMEESKRHYLGDSIDYAEFPMDALTGADALVLVTEWNEFRRPDFDLVKSKLKQPVI